MKLGPERLGEPSACDGCAAPLPSAGGPHQPGAGWYGHGGAHLVIWQPKQKTAVANLCPACAKAAIATLRRMRRAPAAPAPSGEDAIARDERQAGA